ncbi:MAG TPA: SusC/RagA family TonB-linked outer membrane protein [Paludibacter sp.]|nr:SusC/RagA family TonB-linked outer membrane protein [Paludibacter sp.]
MKITMKYKINFARIQQLRYVWIAILTLGIAISTTAQVSVKANNLPIRQILKTIEKNTDFKFFYNDNFAALDKVASLSVTNVPIDNALASLFKESGISWEKKDNNQIVLVPEKKSERQQAQSDGQALKISGTITDPETGESMIGVNVIVKGTSQGVISDSNGKYSLNVTRPATLVFSSIGYITQNVQVTNQSTLNISLEPDTKKLDEVVVVGYGVQKKSDVTGAMISVGEKEIKARPVNNALEAMQGKAAGVDITSNERPGEIGQINIRGVRSITASSSPLYVVDGVPLMSSSGIETINPSDIESIDVLKDASATAIYGSRGANGVILVTTKSGKDGKLTISYSGSVTSENIHDRTKMMNADEYLTWRRWAYYYADPTKYPRGDAPTQANDKVIFLGGNDAYAWNNIMKGWETGTWDGSKVQTTDWTSMVTQTGVSTDHNLSVSGGTDKMKSYASFGYLNSEGTMKGQAYTRFSSKINVVLNPVKWFEMGANINSAYSIQQFGQSTTGGQVSGPGSIYAAANGIFPYAVPYDVDGNRIIYPGGDDMVKTAIDEWKYSQDQRTSFRTLGSFYAQLNILPGLRYRVNFGPDFRYFDNGIFIDAQSVLRNGSPNYASIKNQKDFSWTLDNLLYYDKKIGKNTFGATLLQSASAWDLTSTYLQAVSIPMASQKWNAFNTANIPTTNIKAYTTDLTQRKLLSYMGRLNYSFDDKYMLTVSGRWDGASQLSAGHKWTFFPSAALGWRMDQEEWLKPISWINQMKMRLGVGTTGNSAVEPYATKGPLVSLYYPYGTTSVAGYVPSESLISGGVTPMANQFLGWEKTTQYNLGVDFSIFNGRVSGVIDAYTSRTTDLILQMSIPALTGFQTTFANVGETKNKGIDLTINTVNIKKKSFSWETNLNAAWQKEEIVSLANGKSDDISNNWFIGQSVGILYGYESNGLWKEADVDEMAKFNANGHKFQVGGTRPADLNGDYKIDPNNDRKIIGNTRPRWTLGLNNSFNYKNFELSIFIYSRLGYTYNTNGEWQGGRYVQRSISYYNENNKDAEYQKPIYNVAGGDPYYNALGYKEAAFIKIRNIGLGYTLPISIAKRLSLQNIKIYGQIKNPGMIYSSISWLDLDLGGSTYNKGFVVGLNVGF